MIKGVKAFSTFTDALAAALDAGELVRLVVAQGGFEASGGGDFNG